MTLLGKQAWRLITMLDSLVAMTLMLKYCHNKDFLKVKEKPDSSWIWKSMLTGRDVILKGIDVQVWDGSQTSLHNIVLERIDKSSQLNLQSFMCPNSHTWKTGQVPRGNNQEEQEISKVLQDRAFSIFGGGDSSVEIQ